VAATVRLLKSNVIKSVLRQTVRRYSRTFSPSLKTFAVNTISRR